VNNNCNLLTSYKRLCQSVPDDTECTEYKTWYEFFLKKKMSALDSYQ
jgi:hypothetical protein